MNIALVRSYKPPNKPPRTFFVGVVIVLIIAAWWLYWISKTIQPRNLATVQKNQPTPTKSTVFGVRPKDIIVYPSGYKLLYGNILGLSESKIPGATMSPDGREIIFPGDQKSNWTLYSNNSPSASWRIKGDFAIVLRPILGEAVGENVHATIRLYATNKATRVLNGVALELDKNAQGFLMVVSDGKHRSSQRIPADSGDALVLNFYGIDGVSPEHLTVYSGTTGNNLFTTLMPSVFFTPQTMFQWDFNVGNGLSRLTISDTEFLTPNGLETVIPASNVNK